MKWTTMVQFTWLHSFEQIEKREKRTAKIESREKWHWEGKSQNTYSKHSACMCKCTMCIMHTVKCVLNIPFLALWSPPFWFLPLLFSFASLLLHFFAFFILLFNHLFFLTCSSSSVCLTERNDSVSRKESVFSSCANFCGVSILARKCGCVHIPFTRRTETLNLISFHLCVKWMHPLKWHEHLKMETNG